MSCVYRYGQNGQFEKVTIGSFCFVEVCDEILVVKEKVIRLHGRLHGHRASCCNRSDRHSGDYRQRDLHGDLQEYVSEEIGAGFFIGG